MNSDEFDDELEAADSTALLAGILSELKQIRYELQLQNDIEGNNKDINDIPQYECEMCGDTVDEDNRETHLEREHNAPPTMGIERFFSVK